MNWLSLHVASGTSLFSGVGLLALGVLSCLKGKRRIRFAAKLTACLGMALIYLSSTPFPVWGYAVFMALFLYWLVVESVNRLQARGTVFVSRALVVGSGLLLVLAELPHRRFVFPAASQREQLCVIGDSISAGIDEKPNWPQIFAQRYGVNIKNLAVPAATLRSALRQAALIPNTNCLIVLEIGGNDVLGATSRAEFGRDLKALLASLRQPNRTLVMFELPLLPGQASLGRVQRVTAKEYGAYLIPKKYFCQVLGSAGATIDGLHLSPTGTSLTADVVHHLIGNAPEGPGN